MAKNETKISNAAHIKRHTEGTSNELSFSVLDAAKNRADAEEGRDEKIQIPRFGKVSLFSLPIGGRRKKSQGTPTKEDVLPLSNGEALTASSEGGASSTLGYAGIPSFGGTSSGYEGSSKKSTSKKSSVPYASPEDEILRRKTRRRTRRIFMSAFGAVLVVALVGGGGYYLYSEITKHQEQVSLLDQSLAQLETADEVILPINKQLNAPVDEVALETINDLLSRIPETRETLDKAESLAVQAGENMRDSSDKETAIHATEAINARREILDPAAIILQADVDAKNAVEYMTQAWDTVLKADALARDAAALVKNTTNENVLASKEKSEQALALFNEALYMLDELSNSPLLPDLQKQKDYVAKRAESMQYAIASDEAILVQDRQTAESQNEAYNTADDEAAQAAKQLPSNTVKPVLDAYDLKTEKAKKDYSAAWHKASTADAFLRDYLGT